MDKDNLKNQNIVEKPNLDFKPEENTQRRTLTPEPDRFYPKDLNSEQHKPQIVRQ